VEERGDKAPTRNPAQRLLAAELRARPEAENKKVRELMGNLVVRPAADLLLRPVPSKANQSAERKRARKFLRLRPALNKRDEPRITRMGHGSEAKIDPSKSV
jgi:hypothetical protein